MTDSPTSIVVATMDTRSFSFMAVGINQEHAEAALTAAWAKHCEEYNVPMDPEDEDTPFAEWYGITFIAMEIGDGVTIIGDGEARDYVLEKEWDVYRLQIRDESDSFWLTRACGQFVNGEVTIPWPKLVAPDGERRHLKVVT